MLPVSDKLCSAYKRFVRRLLGGRRGQLRGRRPLRAQHSDRNPNRHVNPDCYVNPHCYPNVHLNLDRDTDAASADSHRNRNQHSWGERLLSVRRLLRGSNRGRMRRMRHRVWSVLRRGVLHHTDTH